MAAADKRALFHHVDDKLMLKLEAAVRKLIYQRERALEFKRPMSEIYHQPDPGTTKIKPEAYKLYEVQIKAPMDILARCDPTSNTFDPNARSGRRAQQGAHLEGTVTLGVYPAAAGGGFDDTPSMILSKHRMRPDKPLQVKTADQTQGLGVVLWGKAIADTWPRHEVTAAPGVDPILLALATYDIGMRYKYAMGSGMGVGSIVGGVPC